MTSMPISRCLVTTHATASRPAAASASPSTVSPRERLANRRGSSRGPGRLPAGGGKNRAALLGECFDCPVNGWKIEAGTHVVGQACVVLVLDELQVAQNCRRAGPLDGTMGKCCGLRRGPPSYHADAMADPTVRGVPLTASATCRISNEQPHAKPR